MNWLSSPVTHIHIYNIDLYTTDCIHVCILQLLLLLSAGIVQFQDSTFWNPLIPTTVHTTQHHKHWANTEHYNETAHINHNRALSVYECAVQCTHVLMSVRGQSSDNKYFAQVLSVGKWYVANPPTKFGNWCQMHDPWISVLGCGEFWQSFQGWLCTYACVWERVMPPSIK